jgi:hypothetical protein
MVVGFTTIILGLWSLSLIQFTLVLTAARARRDQSGLVTRHYNKPQNKGCCAADVYGILISIVLQDAPFLVLRLLLIFKYKVLSYTNMFFTSKNTLVIILLLYRLIVVYIERNNTEVRDSTSDSETPRPFMSKYTAPGIPWTRFVRSDNFVHTSYFPVVICIILVHYCKHHWQAASFSLEYPRHFSCNY